MLVAIVLLIRVLPIVSIVTERLFQPEASVLLLVGRWFVFWAVGVRLLLAGLRQVTQPAFTAQAIFGIKDKSADRVVIEVGFGNLAIGLLGLVTIFNGAWVAPAAIAGAAFFVLAGGKHVLNPDRTRSENIAMSSDLFAFAVLAGYLIGLALTAR